MTINVVFLDTGREPQCKPDPAFPEGRTINLTKHALAKACTRNLPYPAPRCGHYVVSCTECGYRAVISVAGRPDDPRIVTTPCQSRPN